MKNVMSDESLIWRSFFKLPKEFNGTLVLKSARVFLWFNFKKLAKISY